MLYLLTYLLFASRDCSSSVVHQVSAFRALQQSEQIQLLKGGSIELLILRSVLTFDPDKQQFLDPTDSPETRAMNVDQLQSASSEAWTGLFDAHMSFVRSIAVDLQAVTPHFSH